MTKQVRGSGGSTAFKAYAFQQQAFEQLKEIFALVQMEMPVEAAGMPSVNVDIAARSENGRLVLFEAQYTEESRKLRRSTYLSIAALKSAVDELLIEEPPIVTVLSNIEVDDTTKSMFAKAGIPIITLGSDSTQTEKRFREAFQEFGIELPETSGRLSSPKGDRGYCFLAISYHPEYEHVRETIRCAVENAGYTFPLPEKQMFDPQKLLSQILEHIKRSKVVIAEISSGSPNIWYEIGIAKGLGKDVLLISRGKKQLPADLTSFETLFYEDTPDGLKRLQSLLTEALVLAYRKQT